jgi:mannosyltransferase OCH1-like enzyme
MIPKKIHYCWFGPKPFPKQVIKCLKTWEKLFSDYEFFLWNESNSPMDHDYVKSSYENTKYAFVSDYVRFWALYNEGGIYLDTDMYFIKTINDLLDEKCLFGWETKEKNYISCGVIGSEKGNNFIREILNELDSKRFSNKNIDDLIIPRIVSCIYLRTKDHNQVKILPYDSFYSFPYEQRENKSAFLNYITTNTYAVHLWQLSWIPWYTKLFSRTVKSIREIVKYD